MTNELNIFTCSAWNTYCTWFRGQERNMSLPFLHLGVGYFSIQTVHVLVFHLDEFSIDRCLETVDNNLKRKQLCVLKEPHTKYFFLYQTIRKNKNNWAWCTLYSTMHIRFIVDKFDQCLSFIPVLRSRWSRNYFVEPEP